MTSLEFHLFHSAGVSSAGRGRESWLVLIMKFQEKYGFSLVLNIVLTVSFGVAFFVSGMMHVFILL